MSSLLLPQQVALLQLLRSSEKVPLCCDTSDGERAKNRNISVRFIKPNAHFLKYESCDFGYSLKPMRLMEFLNSRYVGLNTAMSSTSQFPPPATPPPPPPLLRLVKKRFCSNEREMIEAKG